MRHENVRFFWLKFQSFLDSSFRIIIVQLSTFILRVQDNKHRYERFYLVALDQMEIFSICLESLFKIPTFFFTPNREFFYIKWKTCKQKGANYNTIHKYWAYFFFNPKNKLHCILYAGAPLGWLEVNIFRQGSNFHWKSFHPSFCLRFEEWE